jgi:hypothetical protein
MTDRTTNAGGLLPASYEQGRRAGLATAAVALGLVSFITLLGLEKAILAVVLGAMAMRGSDGTTRRLGIAAVILGTLFALTVGILLIVFRDRFAELIRLLRQLG